MKEMERERDEARAAVEAARAAAARDAEENARKAEEQARVAEENARKAAEAAALAEAATQAADAAKKAQEAKEAELRSLKEALARAEADASRLAAEAEEARQAASQLQGTTASQQSDEVSRLQQEVQTLRKAAKYGGLKKVKRRATSYVNAVTFARSAAQGLKAVKDQASDKTVVADAELVDTDLLDEAVKLMEKWEEKIRSSHKHAEVLADFPEELSGSDVPPPLFTPAQQARTSSASFQSPAPAPQPQPQPQPQSFIAQPPLQAQPTPRPARAATSATGGPEQEPATTLPSTDEEESE
jgi:hypothetical protein